MSFLDHLAEETSLRPIPPPRFVPSDSESGRHRKGPVSTRRKWLGTYQLVRVQNPSGTWTVMLSEYNFKSGSLKPRLRATGLSATEADRTWAEVVDTYNTIGEG